MTDHNPADDLDLGDASSILRVAEKALLVDPVLQQKRPWQGFITVASFDDSQSAVQIFKFDGILTLPGAKSPRTARKARGGPGFWCTTSSSRASATHFFGPTKMLSGASTQSIRAARQPF